MAVIEINEGIIGLYQHFTKTIGAMVAINTVNPELAYDLAMHVSNLKPKYLTREEVPAAEVEHEREVQRRRVIEEGQPEERADQIVQGRMTKQFFQEIILPEQVFLKDDKKTIAQLLKEKGNAQVLKMARFAIGETEAEASTE
jgi:elongation factor Ts